ncbi:MAG TPA: magnesium/cobalt transporter CorA [bacterium]|nr:magnesium/cobalt transporter CorA [bacterium]
MLSELRKRARKAGLTPGTIVFAGEQRTDRVRITVTDFDQASLDEVEVAHPDDCAHYRDSGTTSWIDVVGLHDVDLLERLGGIFSIHSLVLEDIAHPGQRAKLEDHEDYLYIVVRAVTPDAESEQEEEQVSLIVGRNYLLTFRERPSTLFDAVRQRIRASRGRVRRSGVDYLAYALLDAVVDQYFVVLEDIGEALEDMEEVLLTDPGPECLEALHELRKQVLTVRRAVWPVRDMLNAVMRGESELFDAATLPYLRDLQDHTLHVMDIVENFREMQTSLMEVYLSSISQRTNEVMKVLTIIATIFIPLTFAAGVYGMNFEHMPELHWRWGYGAFWVVIAAVTAVQVYFMRRKHWL